MEFLRSRINAVDAAIRVYQGVRTEYLKADEDATSDQARENILGRLRGSAIDLEDSAARLIARIDGDS